MESNYVVNVKTKVGTIITVRGNTADEFKNNINELVYGNLDNQIGALEELFLGQASSQSNNTAVNLVANALGATVISETPVAQPQSFAPVAPPVSSALVGAGTAQRSCIHGVMTKREGVGPYGPYRAFMCPTEKGTPDQCKPIYLKKNDPDYAAF